MMGENPNWWMSNMQAQQLVMEPLNSLAHDQQEFPQSWSQLLMGGLASEEDHKFGANHFQSKKLENWEEPILSNSSLRVPVFDAREEVGQRSRVLYGHGDDEFQTSTRPCTWSHHVMPVSSSPRSSLTSRTLSGNILDFQADGRNNQYPHHHSAECNSTAAGGISKKARVQSSSSLPPLKVRKEKLGDRITALHQLVSPFGKTDTASVLLEAISYIGFLQGQIQALSFPYLGNAPPNMRHQQSGNKDGPKDLRSKGLCLVPVSCTHHVTSENGADYWAPALGGGF